MKIINIIAFAFFAFLCVQMKIKWQSIAFSLPRWWSKMLWDILTKLCRKLYLVRILIVIRAVASLTVPGGQAFHFPHFFLKFRSIFPQTLLIFFLILALRVPGDSPTREGPGYATDSNYFLHMCKPTESLQFLPERVERLGRNIYRNFKR